MSETKNVFYGRSYWDWAREKVWVYPVARNIGKPEIWTLNQAIQYVNYLERQKNESS